MDKIGLHTKKKYDVVDITEDIVNIVNNSGVDSGTCFIYVRHTTCAVIINENYDPNICDDFLDALSELIPEGKWMHDKIDNNGAAHIKSSIIGPSEFVFIKSGKLKLSKWQNIMLCDFDGPRDREILVKVVKDEM